MSLTASYVTMAAAEARLEPASASDADDPRSCPHAAATCPRQRSDSAASRIVLLFFFLGGCRFVGRRRCGVVVVVVGGGRKRGQTAKIERHRILLSGSEHKTTHSQE